MTTLTRSSSHQRRSSSVAYYYSYYSYYSAAMLAVVALWSLPSPGEAHGRLIEPPSRASAWRYGFKTPANYDDTELYCGGFTNQQNLGGKCGVCGDPWNSKVPRAHEYGGKYGQGVIVRRYSAGARIVLRVELTASHNGYFEFAVCPNFKNTTQECLDRYPLALARSKSSPPPGSGVLPRRYYPTNGSRVYEMRYQLPKMTCAHCVLQWRYIAGNNWGVCRNGTGAVGCGPQEEFRACADITIDRRDPADTSMDDDVDVDNTSNDVETNEVPMDHVPAVPAVPVVPGDAHIPPATPPAAAYNPVSSILLSLMTFLVVSAVLCLLYWHYYRIGGRLRAWMLRRHQTLLGDKTGKKKKKVSNLSSSSQTKTQLAVQPAPTLPVASMQHGKGVAPLPPPRAKKERRTSLCDGGDTGDTGDTCAYDVMHEINLRGGESNA